MATYCLPKLNNSFWERSERLTNLRRLEQQADAGVCSLAVRPYGIPDSSVGRGRPAGWQLLRLAPLPTAPQAKTVQEAVTFLKRTSLLIEPRRQWPAGGNASLWRQRENFKRDEQIEPGMALSIWGDAGWGTAVKAGKYNEGRFQ